jgi:hypothetical protein
VRAACRRLEACGLAAGWGLFVLGVVSGLERLLATTGSFTATPVPWLPAFLGASSRLLGFALVGLGVAVLSRVCAAVVMASLNEAARVHERTVELASQALILLERIAGNVRHGDLSADLAKEAKREQSVAGIEQAIQRARWAEAEALLDAFATDNPDDQILAIMREQLRTARGNTSRAQLAELTAAREVSDPQRVLEIYQVLAPNLEQEARSEVDRELAHWCLNLIHRRLRTGKIQVDVVQLAARVSEVFAKTVEGASLRASLPTLRRSVGLCPRCGQPYTGIGDACPKCLTGVAASAAGNTSHPS